MKNLFVCGKLADFVGKILNNDKLDLSNLNPTTSDTTKPVPRSPYPQGLSDD